MNQISSRFYLCGRSSSLLRKNPFTTISSSSSSSSSLISKFHQRTLNYPAPPQIFSIIPGNYFRKFNGEAAATTGDEFYVGDDYIEKEISDVYLGLSKARDDIESCKIPPLDVVKIPAAKFNTLMEKLGIKKAGDYPNHLQRFREKIEDLDEDVDIMVAFGEYVAAGGAPGWGNFENWWDASGGAMFEKEEEISANQVLIASLKKSKINSKLMKELIEDFEVLEWAKANGYILEGECKDFDVREWIKANGFTLQIEGD